MKQRPRIYYSDSQKALMWERWRQGATLHEIAGLFDRGHSSIHRILNETGGIRPQQRHRSSRALSLAEREEISRAVVAGQSPKPTDWAGMRDRAMLHLAFAAGLRVSELTGLRLEDLSLHPHASILVRGKGRKERCLPLWKQTTVALRAWLAVRGVVPAPELFVNARREPMTRAGFEYVLEKHIRIASQCCPSLATKRISPHVLRHSCALTVLQATKDLRKVALWLGHASMQTTEMYTRADPSIKLEALDAVTAPKLRSGRFHATDKLIALLTEHTIMRREKRPI